MLEDKKILGMQSREFINEYLVARGISSDILKNPRYQSILWKISNILIKENKRNYSEEAKEFLDSIVKFDDAKNISFIEEIDENSMIITCRYYIDELDGKLKQIRSEKNYTLSENPLNDYNRRDDCITVSEYNSDGIEECLSTEQTVSFGKYFSKATRVPNRLDVIKIERIKLINDNLTRLDDIYQIRCMQVALEDIYPTKEEIDPYDIMHFSVLGFPKIYKDLNYEEQLMMSRTNGKVLPLSENDRIERFKEYKRLNEMYGRTKAFENGMAKAFLVKNRDFNE